MNSNIDSVKIQKWPRWCIGSLLLYALLVSPSLIIRYNAIAKNFGALLLALSMFSLIMYFTRIVIYKYVQSFHEQSIPSCSHMCSVAFSMARL